MWGFLKTKDVGLGFSPMDASNHHIANGFLPPPLAGGAAQVSPNFADTPGNFSFDWDCVETSASIERRLSEAWLFLAGQDLKFKQVHPPCNRPRCEQDWQVILPFTIEDGVPSACRLTISVQEARKAAALMFGAPEAELSQEDLDDAAKEICNVLGSCLLEGRAGEKPARIGVPQSVNNTSDQRFELLSQYEPESHSRPLIDELRSPLVGGAQRNVSCL
jgi:hypothetical protein